MGSTGHVERSGRIPDMTTDEPEINVVRLDRSGSRQVLGDLEVEIMELMWTRPAGEGATVRPVVEALYERRHLTYTSAMTTMARLARKRMLRVEKEAPDSRQPAPRPGAATCGVEPGH